MGKKFKDIDIKNRTYYFFDDMIHTKNIDSNKMKIDENPYKKKFVYCIGYVTVKDLRHIKIHSVNSYNW